MGYYRLQNNTCVALCDLYSSSDNTRRGSNDSWSYWYIYKIMRVFGTFALFSILLFVLVITKRTYVAQLLGPGIPEPFVTEKFEDMRMWLAPY